LIAHKDNERKKEGMIIKANDRKNMQVFEISCHFEYNSDRSKVKCVYLPSTPVMCFKNKLRIHTLDYMSIKASSILIAHKDNERKKEGMIIKANDRKNMQVFKISCHFEYNSDRSKVKCVYLPSTPVMCFKKKVYMGNY
jgi:hypothetical protein